MGFRSGSYAAVFNVKKGSGNFYDVNITTSKKDRNTGTYNTDFRGFARFVGKAADVISKYNGKNGVPVCRIKLGDVEVTNSYNKEKNVTYTNYVVFTCEIADGNNQSGNNKQNQRDIASYVNAMPSMSADEEGLFT